MTISIGNNTGNDVQRIILDLCKTCLNCKVKANKQKLAQNKLVNNNYHCDY